MTVYYFRGNDYDQALIYQNFIKDCLKTIRDKQMFGKWELEEKIKYNDSVPYLEIEMTSDKYPDLRITLYSKLGTNEQNIKLFFETES